jgi:hypothetical protein
MEDLRYLDYFFCCCVKRLIKMILSEDGEVPSRG